MLALGLIEELRVFSSRSNTTLCRSAKKPQRETHSQMPCALSLLIPPILHMFMRSSMFVLSVTRVIGVCVLSSLYQYILSALSYVRVRGCVVLWLCVCACVYECMIVFFCQTLVVRSTIPCSHNLCVCTQAVARFPCHCARMHSSNLPLICTALYIDAPFAHMLYMVYTGTQVGQKNTLLTSCIPVEPVPSLITPVSLISI